jgi:hypothetical protein
LVIALPPSAGALNVTVICALAATTVGRAGADGTVLGITTAEGAEAGPSPSAFVAVTVHVYDFPFDRPVTTTGEATPDADPGLPPSDDTQLTA